MLSQAIRFSIRNRLFVLAAALVLMLFGGWQTSKLPVDVFPDLNRPTVTLLTEAPGLADVYDVGVIGRQCDLARRKAARARRWLELAGFQAGQRVRIEVQQGRLVITLD